MQSTDRSGLIAEAEGGTLFLDEIGDLPLDLQPKLLRVLQEREFHPVGSNKSHKTDARFVVATHRDLNQMVKANTFREAPVLSSSCGADYYSAYSSTDR